MPRTYKQKRFAEAAGKLPTSSPLTKKGDIWVYSTADVALSVGSDGDFLFVDSGQATGLKWFNLLISANTWTKTQTFTGNITTGGGTVQSQAALKGSQSGAPPTARGGSIAVYKNTADVVGYIYADANGYINFDAAAQSGNLDAGTVWIDPSAGDLGVTGDLNLGGAVNWTVENAATVGARLTPEHSKTVAAAAGDTTFIIDPKGEDSGGLREGMWTLQFVVRDPTDSAEEGEIALSVMDGSGGLAQPLVIIGETTPGVALHDGTRLEFDATGTSGVGSVKTRGTTYMEMNGNDLELWVKGVLTRTWESGVSGGGGGDSFLEWAGL